MKFKESEIQRLSAKESKLQDDLQRVRNALAAQEPRERALAKEVKRRAGALSAAEAAVTEVHSKYFRSFSERLGVENVHQLMEMHDKAMAEFNAAEARFKSQLAQLKNHLSLLKKQLKDVCAKEASIQATMAKDEQAVVDLKAKEAEFCARKADLEAEIATEQEAIQQLQVQIDANEEEVNAIQKEAAQALGEVNKMRRGIASKKSQLEQLAVQLEDTLEAASRAAGGAAGGHTGGGVHRGRRAAAPPPTGRRNAERNAGGRRRRRHGDGGRGDGERRGARPGLFAAQAHAHRDPGARGPRRPQRGVQVVH